MDNSAHSPSARNIACAPGEHTPDCPHPAIQHGDHVGYVNEDGNLDCLDPDTKKPQLHKLEDKENREECGKKTTHSSGHKHSTNCDHPEIVHGDHVDYLNGDELHYQHGDHCDVHDRVKIHEGSLGSLSSRSHSVVRFRDTIHDDHSKVGVKSKWYHDKDAMRFFTMFFLTGTYFFVELIYGSMIGSLALVADAMHMLSDFIALVVGFYAMRVTRKKATPEATYGFRRMEVVAALMNATFMLSICLNIALEAIGRFVKGPNKDLSEGVVSLLIVSGIGLLMNLVGMVIFGHGHSNEHEHEEGGHGHGHGHGSGGGGGEHKSGGIMGIFSSCLPDNMNLRGVLLHVAGDALGSIAVIVSALIIWFCSGDWRYYSDPVCSLLIVAIIVAGTIPLVKESCTILLQNTPNTLDTGEIKETILGEKGVLEVHCLHVWTLSGRNHVASMHLVILEGADFMSISDNVKHILHEYGIHANSIQPEFVRSRKELGSGGMNCLEPMCGGESCIRRLCCKPQDQIDAHTARTSGGR